MLIYLVRHGSAVDQAASDAARELNREGIIQVRSMVEKWKPYAPVPDKALVSPYQRARQTAAGMRKLFPSLRFDVEKKIEPDGDPYAVLDFLENCGAHQVLLVSHNPFLSKLLSVMVDGTLESHRMIGTGTLVCVVMDYVAPGCGKIQYTLEP